MLNVDRLQESNYLNVIDKCTVFMNMRDFSKMRMNNE